jgi:heme-degrading monooxygenase HmoA
MVVRLTFCKFIPERILEAKRIYNDEVVPTVKKLKGNMGIRLLEPVNKSDDYVSVTEWKTKEDADAYHTSGTYRNLVSKLESYFVKQPELRIYTAEEVRIAIHDQL